MKAQRLVARRGGVNRSRDWLRSRSRKHLVEPTSRRRAAGEETAIAKLAESFSLPAEESAACCAEDCEKSVLLAQADTQLAQAKKSNAQKQPPTGGKKPNIVVIMGDDIGIWNIGAYHRGMMAGRTPNLDKLAQEGMLFTDYYAEASCTAGRAAFITGQLPIRTGLTTVGQAGAKVGMPAEGLHDRHRAQGPGLCHGPVRQEPSGRSQRVPADRSRLR